MRLTRCCLGIRFAFIPILSGFAAFAAQADIPLPPMADPNLQNCLSEHASRNGWQYAEQVVQLLCPGRNITNLQGLESLANLAELDLGQNKLRDVTPLQPLRSLTTLKLSGNPGIALAQLRPVLDMNWGLTSLGLNGIKVGAFNNLGALFNPQTGQPYALVELDLGNTKLSNFDGGKNLDFLAPFAGTLARLNVAGNGIDNIQALGQSWNGGWNPSGANFANLNELDLSDNGIVDASPLASLHNLGKLKLSGNLGLTLPQLRPVIDMNRGLTSLGLNGIEVGTFNNLGPLFNWETGQPYALTELDLGNTKLTDNNGGKSLDFLAPFATTLSKLNVAGNGIDNLQVFWTWMPAGPGFPNLSELDLSNNAITDVAPLGPLHTLTKLNLSGNTGVALMQLRPVIDFNRGLTSLGLNGIEVGAFNNLGPLLNWETGQPYALKELDLGNTRLADNNGGKGLDFLAPFAGTLTKLNVAGNGIDNLQAFGAWTPAGPGFPNLSELDLSNNAITDVAPLVPLHNLTKLNLSGNTGIALTQLRPVIDFSRGLTSLGLNGIEVGTFNNLGPLFNWETGQPYALTELDLGNTNLTDNNGGKGLDFLAPFAVTLSKLNVAGNGIDNIQALATWTPDGPGFAALTELDLSDNAVTDANPLLPLHKLVKLNLSGNTGISIMQLRPVLDMNWGLTSLRLNGIQVGQVSNLGPLSNPQAGKPYALKELDLGNTQLADYNGGKSLDFLAPYAATLTKLNVSGNGINNIQALATWMPNGPGFAKLAELDLSNNAITDANPLFPLHNLVKLNLSGNSGIMLTQLRPVIDTNWKLTSLGLNGIQVGPASNLGLLFNPQAGKPYALEELDLGNTNLSDNNGGKSLDFLAPFAATLAKLKVSGNGIDNIQALATWTPNGPGFAKLAELDLSNNAIIDANPLFPLHNLVKLNLSGNSGVMLTQLRPVIDTNWKLTSLGLNGIQVGSFSNLGPLFNPQANKPYALKELDLGNTQLADFNGGKSLDFLAPFAATLTKLNVAGNGIGNLQVFGIWTPEGPGFAKLAELDLSSNAIVDVNPLYPLHGLGLLNLFGNGQIACNALEMLSGMLPHTQIQRPASCL